MASDARPYLKLVSHLELFVGGGSVSSTEAAGDTHFISQFLAAQVLGAWPWVS